MASWPAIFFVNLPVGVIALILGWPGLAESRNPAARRIDLPGQVLVAGALVCLMLALIESSSAGWTSPLILGLCLGSVVLFASFLLVEAHVREPLLPLHLFGNRVFSVANGGGVVLGFVILGVVFFLAQYFQAVQGATALQAGLQTLPITVGTFMIAPVAGQLTARTTPRLPTVLGAGLSSGALFLPLDLTPASSFASLWWKLGLLGVGIGFMFSPLTVAVLSATPAARSGLASSMVSTGRQIGSTLGVAVLGAFVLQQFTGNIASQLAQRGVPGPISTTIAGKIASAGAQAGKIPLSGRLSLSPIVLHQAIGQAFVDALHGSFLISAITMLVTAVLVLLIFPSKQRITTTSVASADPGVPTGARDVQYEML